MKKILFLIFSSIIVFAVTVFFRLGGHKNVMIKIIEAPSMHVLYKEHTGAYHHINNVITEVEAWALKQNIDCRKTFGEYLDDPSTVDERRLRSHGGCVLSVEAKSIQAEAEKSGYLVKTIVPAKYVQAIFTGAPSIGPLKVYPKVENFISSNALQKVGTVIEVYKIFNNEAAETEFLFPVK